MLYINNVQYLCSVNLINSVKMENKQIQEQRMKGYFIRATKDLLKGEGLKSISVRSIADRAGYSYATMYNYFKDIKDLIFICVQDFQVECEDFVMNETRESNRGFEKIHDIMMAFCKYFIQYPGIFELFYLEKMSSLVSKQPTAELINSFPDKLCQEEWDFCLENRIVNVGSAAIMKMQINSVATGMLLLYLNRRCPDTYEEFMGNMKTMLGAILNRKSKGPGFE
jgi:AcrR family transcriptional regulator